MRNQVRPLAILLAALSTLGCGAAQRAPNEPLSVGQWCDEVMAETCHLAADLCFGGSSEFDQGCREGTTSCSAGRDRSAPAGRTGADLDACVGALRAAECSEILVVAGSRCALDPAR